METASENAFDPVNFGRHVAGRKSGNLSNRSRVQAFEVGENDLPVERFQLLNQIQQLVKSPVAICDLLAAVWVAEILQFIESDEGLRSRTPMLNDMRGGGIVRHAVNPGTKRASLIESREAAPQGYMNVLY
jgi:hypothetical protein